jgi:hypothetical protein
MKSNGVRPRVLVGETYLDSGSGRVVQVLDCVRSGRSATTTFIVEAIDGAHERLRCAGERLTPATEAPIRKVDLLAISHRLLARGERLLGDGDVRGAAGAFSSAALALDALAGELGARASGAGEGSTLGGEQVRTS